VGNPRDGHIAGAKNIPYPDLIDPNNSSSQWTNCKVILRLSSTRKKRSGNVLLYRADCQRCYLAGRILGYHMKLYDGSMQEWSRIKELPMELTEKK